jgi:DNA-binding NarL/FixJ family response regulator
MPSEHGDIISRAVSSEPQQVRIVIADDHPIFRYGIRRLLEAEANFKVVGEASDGAEAVTRARVEARTPAT